ncbi:MAG: carbamoyltransferase HypF [Candidatus Thermoplasmatota archaeon]|nr:carbamoyltransferase HypF [Candidatus Thermoplasmatota archaeon]
MKLILKGTVQGVGFRPTVYRVAKSLGLKGYVKNKGGKVEVVIDRDPDIFLEKLEENLPPLAEIKEIERHQESVSKEEFKIVKSSHGEKESSTIPVDTALCEECLKEMKDEDDRRESYAFTNCTNCGARYSAIYSLPYDREKTTMKPFLMCEDCLEEYKDPIDRRFHAQTTSCPECGPEYTLYDENGNEIGGISDFVTLVEKGNIGVAKSWGGMHIICKLEKIPDLRDDYQRPQKPFAIMVRDLKTAKRYAKVEREDLFTGPRRPIMVFEKKDRNEKLLDYAATGLPTIGIMLPYTGFHHIFFEKSELDAIVMTSANLPGEPMIIDNNEAFDLPFEYFLLHNRKIANRVDDSLVRTHGQDAFIIRRSRGYVPSALKFEEGEIMAAGADKSGCFALSTDGLLYASQYLGDLKSYDATKFYEKTANHLMSLLGIEDISTVAVDLHPKYQSRRLGLDFAEKFNAETQEVQHHWAHGASLLLEHDLEEIITIAVDGTGYGEDGNSWGGEVLYCDKTQYERLNHLESFPLLGGEKAVRDPERLVFAIQRKKGFEGNYFDEKQKNVFDKMMDESVKTTSFGRLLDAVSAGLDVCKDRTYEGEPAMKLENLLIKGRSIKKYEVEITKDKIKTLDPFVNMMKDDGSRKNRAASYIESVSKAIAKAAIQASDKKGIDEIGISGGVSYNRPIVESIRSYLQNRGYELLVHKKVPNGDMGIPFGQAVIASAYNEN